MLDDGSEWYFEWYITGNEKNSRDILECVEEALDVFYKRGYVTDKIEISKHNAQKNFSVGNNIDVEITSFVAKNHILIRITGINNG